jgi:hypothetical protein
MKKYLLFALGIISFKTVTFAQDMLIVPKLEYHAIECRVISADRQNVIYRTPESEVTKSISTDLIVRLNFEQAFDQIVRPILVYDTIYCTILAINNEEIIYFSSDDFINKSIPKSGVLLCHLKHGCSNADKEFFTKQFAAFQDQFRKRSANTILKKDGTQIQTEGVDIDDEKLYFEIYQGESKIQTFADRNKVKSFIYSEYIDKSAKKIASNYLLSTGGNLRECIVTKIDTGILSLEIKMDENVVRSEVGIDKVCALFFGPPAMSFEKDEGQVYKPIEVQRNVDKTARVDFYLHGMLGYYFADQQEDLPDQLTDYVNELRSGFGFGVDLNVYANIHSSLGLTYKFMNNSNSIDDINIDGITSTSDDINVNFIGLNYQYSTLRRGIFVYDLVLAGGYVAYKDMGSINEIALTMKGQTFGLNFTNRFNFMASDNVGFYVDLSIFYAALNSVKIQGQTVDLDEPEDISRIELGIGIKFSGQ